MGKEAKHRDKLGMDMKRLCIWAVGGGCSRNEAVETHTNPHFIGYIGGGIRRIKNKSLPIGTKYCSQGASKLVYYIIIYMVFII